jgi:hypothetical protein
MLKNLATGNKLFMSSLPVDMKVAVVDVDDVLWPCTQILLDHYNKKYETDINIDALTNFNIECLFPQLKTKDALVKSLIHDFDYMCVGNFYSYAKHLIDKLVANNFYIAVVTARGFHPEGYAKTFLMMKKQGIHFDALGTTRIGQSKLDFVLEHIPQEPYVVLEDNTLAMKEFHKYGTKVIKFEKPWNVKCSDHSHVVRQDASLQDLSLLVESL